MTRSLFQSVKYGVTGIFALGLILTSCGKETTSDPKIYGGSKVSKGQWPSTIGLVSGRGINCSGTVVHPNLVITAAHCVSGVWSPSSLSVYSGEGKEGGRISGQYQVSRFEISPKYGRKTSGWDDIAYLVLEEPFDIEEADIPEILFADDEIEEVLGIGNSVRLVGFGTRDGGGYGVKYEVDAEITRVTDNEVYIGKDGKDSCQGDSGGPAYGQLANGEWRVFGVVSRGGRCGTGGIWGRMSANICWVQEDSGIDLGLPCN
ncbi:Trypsin [Pseudobacteriovorax antillogorgiicola]|uniref:Trypsin n=2 Tax=Pseudobacteriovorax antillogorgiicola TaxID=1513793 RepID=A0A1Y6CM47_9BACT|nr:trypsin [Pseudobacteriovorax antillogorgiicola]SMF62139.1 Trypsin [Pseudobacteriovorax antillogorgiicola]